MSHTIDALAANPTPAALPAPRIVVEQSGEHRGFSSLRCPFCGEEDKIQLAAHEVTLLSCANCEREFSPADVREIIDGWLAFLGWLESAPPI